MKERISAVDAALEESRRNLDKELAACVESAESATVPASSERAEEIARMDSFGALEFWELTGVESGRYSIYNITEKGVTLTLSASDTDLPEESRVAIRGISQRWILDFPCEPEKFCEWYENTKAQNGISDFPLADGFLKALGRCNKVKPINDVAPVTSEKIIEAFKVLSSVTENKQWWNSRMRSAQKYGLLDARAAPGGKGRGRPSFWHPMVLAAWLIEKKHLSRNTVIQAIQMHFPACDTSYLDEA